MCDFIQIRFVDQHGVEWKRSTSMRDVGKKMREEKERDRNKKRSTSSRVIFQTVQKIITLRKDTNNVITNDVSWFTLP